MKIFVNISILTLVVFCFFSCNTDNPIESASTTEQNLSTSQTQLKTLPIETDEFHLVSPANNYQSPYNFQITFNWEKWQMAGYVQFEKYVLNVNSTTGGSNYTYQTSYVNQNSSSLSLDRDIYEWTVTAYYWGTWYNPWVYVELPYEETWTLTVGTKPATPNLEVSWYQGHPKISWDEDENADGFKIYRCNVPHTTSILLADITTTSYVDYGKSQAFASPAEYVQYAVVAYNNIGHHELDPNSGYIWVQSIAIKGDD